MDVNHTDNENQKVSIRGTIQGGLLNQNPPRGFSDLNMRLSGSKRNVILGITAGVILVSIALGAVLATRIWDPLWNPFRPAPEKVLKQAMTKMQEIKTLHSAMSLGMEFQSQEKGKLEIIIEGDADTSDPKNPKAQDIFDISASAQGMKINFGGEMRSLNEINYFKINTIPMALSFNLSRTGIDLEAVKGKWVRFDPKELGISTGPMAISLEDKMRIKKEMQQLVEKYPVVKVKKELPDQKLQQKLMYHYILTIEKEQLKPFLIEAIGLLQKRLLMKDAKVDEKDKQEIYQSIDDLFNAVGGEINFDIWIGKKDLLVYRVASNELINYSAAKDSTFQKRINIDFAVDLSQFNKPVEIKAPEESVSIIEMLVLIIQKFYGAPEAPSTYQKQQSAVPFPIQ